MAKALSKEDMIDTPNVSILMPFEPMMHSKSELVHRLELAAEKVASQLMEYDGDKHVSFIQKLKQVLRGLNYNTHKKSIAIFVSAVAERVFYFDIPVKEAITVNSSFEIRDIINCKKRLVQFLVLLLDSDVSEMYLATDEKLNLIKSNTAQDSIEAHRENQHEKKVDEFLRKIDKGLSLVLKAYDLPVLLMGPEDIVSTFREISFNKEKLIQHVYGSYTQMSPQAIHNILQPYIDNWNEIKRRSIAQQLEKAFHERRLVCGTQQVYSKASSKNSKLVIVENDFTFPVSEKTKSDTKNASHPFYIKNGVDEVIEKVLDNGGDAEFVDHDLLAPYGRIALLQE